jgi:predicted dehydrogenase
MECLRIGIVGASPTRGWGRLAHLPALVALPEFDLVAVATSRPETARATAAEFGVPLAFGDPEALIGHEDVEVVAITVKVPEHDHLVRSALEAGKHVYVEWPLGIDLAQAAALAELSAASPGQHVVGLQGCFAPGASFLRELIDSGSLGRPLAVSLVAAGGPGGSIVEQGSAYTADPASGATVLSITTGHVLATLEPALGGLQDVSALVASVNDVAVVAETGERIALRSPDQVALNGTLPGGLVLSIVVQGSTSPGVPSFDMRVVGTEATLAVRAAELGGIHRAAWKISRASLDGSVEELSVPERFAPIPSGVPAGPPRNVALAYRHFAEAIAEGRPAEPSFARAVHYHELLAVIERASDSGIRQTLS